METHCSSPRKESTEVMSRESTLPEGSLLYRMLGIFCKESLRKGTLGLSRYTVSGSYELFLEHSKQLISFEVTADDKARLRNVEAYQGNNITRTVLDFSLENFISAHIAEGNSIYFGKFNGSSAQGLGVKLDTDGRYSAGCFSKGKLGGVCKVALPENDLFFGNMKDDFPEGEGLFYDSVRKQWLYGFFKDFECVTLVKEGISNALPYKKRIFLNMYENSKANERCSIDIPLVDFGKDIMKQLEPHLSAVLSQMSDNGLQPSTARSCDSWTKIDDCGRQRDFQIRSKSGETTKKTGPLDVLCNKEKRSTRERRAKSAKKQVEQLQDARNPTTEQKNEKNSGRATNQSYDSLGQYSNEQLANFNIGQLSLRNNSRLGTINEGEEDFCRSKSSIGDKNPNRVIDKTNILQTKLYLGSNRAINEEANHYPRDFKERVPSPKPTTYEELSPFGQEQRQGFQLQWQKQKSKGTSSSFTGIVRHHNLEDAAPLDSHSMKKNTRSEIDLNSHSLHSVKDGVQLGLKFSKPAKNEEASKGLNHQPNISHKQWEREEQVKFQQALHKLGKLDQLVYQLQQQVSRSRATQIIF